MVSTNVADVELIEVNRNGAIFDIQNSNQDAGEKSQSRVKFDMNQEFNEDAFATHKFDTTTG